jgi:hypothetical protein
MLCICILYKWVRHPVAEMQPTAEMARLLLSPVLVVFSLAAASFVSNAGVAEADGWHWHGWHGWNWRHTFRGRFGHHGRRSHISSIVSEEVYASLFLHKDDAACPAKNFYNYSAFVSAAERFPEFGSAGRDGTRRREVAAFLAQISHETTGGWATAPDGPFAWGLCFKEEITPPSNYCDANNTEWRCVPGKSYHGRGPMQLSW